MVFMMHALLDSSAAYVINGPGKSLGFIAADAGYDVRAPPSYVSKPRLPGVLHKGFHKGFAPMVHLVYTIQPTVMAVRQVWMGNSRGNIYARRHVSLDVSSDAFWAFDW